MAETPVNVITWQPDRERRWWRFSNPVEVLAATAPEQVLPVLERAEQRAKEGLHAVGFVAYEASPAFDGACSVAPAGPLPLAWFGVFEAPLEFRPPGETGTADHVVGAWEPSAGPTDHARAVAGIRAYLRSGDTYQVNYTMRLRASCESDPVTLFMHLLRGQKARYCAFIDTGRFAICSASPELFFSLDGRLLLSRPMKGTARRGLTLEEDRRLAYGLRRSAKNRAENVMIVDMVRNDMGRVADRGSVRVRSLFNVERYPTVLQMTSTVECRTSASVAGIFRALFPCASVTGAPKIRTMQIIAELEKEPRGIYTGAIGWIGPRRRASFNVAIRTVCVDRETRTAEYGVGGGIVWDSKSDREYRECRVKAAVLTAPAPCFRLLETMLWDPRDGFFLRDRHLARLARSAAYFGFKLDVAEIGRSLGTLAESLRGGRQRIRLLVTEDGDIKLECAALEEAPAPVPWDVAIAAGPVDVDDQFLYHKTTNRGVYESAKRAAGKCDDVLLWNSSREATESTLANLVVIRDGRCLTPPVRCGLLAGTFREWLLERGDVSEGVVTLDDLRDGGTRAFLVNSVRGWIPVRLRSAAGK